ncbi:pilus assembly protein PilE [Ahniella affigens]|uniref:Pilus assembly protein PilE n=1 Tax=Ahniella affigens TaxID=2021234 RepID=A0A2P1PY97_9GAMM|nr:type IV pilin protein [Ahniella affigens]AVP99818.1 pilus assembly protein PilE [Ahniella affigens]
MTHRPLVPARGFSLIEVLIAMLIIMILAALAYPSYARFVRESRRVEVQSLLLDLQMREERWRAEHPEFADAATLGVAGLISNHPSARWYAVQIQLDEIGGYRLIADAAPEQADDQQEGVSCTPLTLGRNEQLPKPCW